MTVQQDFEAVVVGGGPAGLAAALALAVEGVETAVVVPPAAPAAQAPGGRPETRTAALFPSSLTLLRNLGAWQICEAAAEPLLAIRICDGTGRLPPAPEVMFRASEAGRDSFGCNIPTGTLTAALRRRAGEYGPPLTVIESAGVTAADVSGPRARLALSEGGTLSARLVAAADGRTSLCRTAAGIGARTWSYRQSALVCTFSHSLPHGGVSTELHTLSGPMTVVPLPGRTSSLVLVERPAVVQDLAAMDATAFREALERRLQGICGTLGETGPRAVFPLSGLAADTMGARRTALAGEAGHVFPPIGAQGLNLGLRDGATLAECAGNALRRGGDPGGDETLAAYVRARQADVLSRIVPVDVLGRSLTLSRFYPVHLARGAGLAALKLSGPLRRSLIRAGLEPPGELPALMRSGSAGPDFPAAAA